MIWSLRATSRKLELIERVQGKDHPRVANFSGELADIALAEDRRADAIALLERAVPLAERTLGPEHVETRRYASLLERARTGSK